MEKDDGRHWVDVYNLNDVRMPPFCVCCGSESELEHVDTHAVIARTALPRGGESVEYATLQFPYCRKCGRHARWSHEKPTAGTPIVIPFVVIPVAAATWFSLPEGFRNEHDVITGIGALVVGMAVFIAGAFAWHWARKRVARTGITPQCSVEGMAAGFEPAQNLSQQHAVMTKMFPASGSDGGLLGRMAARTRFWFTRRESADAFRSLNS